MIFPILRRRFAIDTISVQRLTPTGPGERFEGLGFSSSGNVLGVATADTNAVLFFRRKPNGRLENEPYSRISAKYPHDVSFGHCGHSQYVAVAQRGGSISLFRENAADGTYGPDPTCDISGPEARLAFSDGAAFVPPHDDFIAACNLISGCISFYPRTCPSPLHFDSSPAFELRHESILQPDGLAFSSCGTWLATANHGGNSVSIFQRQSRQPAAGAIVYGPDPTNVIAGSGLRYPHSVAFTAGKHLVVTNAGTNFFAVYRCRRRFSRGPTLAEPVWQQAVNEEALFHAVNAKNKMEGGPKGVAIHKGCIAVCSPEIGVKLYSFRE